MNIPDSILDWIDVIQAETPFKDPGGAIRRFNMLRILHDDAVTSIQDSTEGRESTLTDIKRFLTYLAPFIEEWLKEKATESPADAPPLWFVAILRILNLSSSSDKLGNFRFGYHNISNILTATPPPQSMEQMLEIAWNDANKPPPIPMEALADDFCEPYVGSGPLQLHNELCRFHEKHQLAYAAVLPILQTSGVGKSRTVAELSTHAPGIMLCLRPGQKEGSNSYTSLPKQDESICHFLQERGFYDVHEWGSLENATIWIGHCTVAALLSATAIVLSEQLAIAHQAIVARQGQTGDKQTIWPLLVEQMSRTFFDDIVPGYRAGNTTPPSSPKRSQPQAVRGTLVNRIAREALKIARSYQAEIPPEQKPSLLYARAVAEKLAGSVSEQLKSLAGYEGIQYVFLALDEFDTFGDLLSPARRVMSYLIDYPIRLLLLDTNNKPAHVTGPVAHLASLRTTDGMKLLPDPYLIMSQDVRLRQSEQRQPFEGFLSGKISHTHEDIMKFLPYMGRPLWGDRTYQSKGHIAEISTHQVLLKMGLRTVSPTDGINSSDQSDGMKGKHIALAACRLPLNIVGAQGSSNTAAFLQAQISRHLRWVIGFENSGDLVSTAALSEPVMSLAAAAQYRRGNRTTCLKEWADAISAIRDAQSTGCLTIGENGEEFVRMLFTIAMDLQALESPEGNLQVNFPTRLPVINLGKLLDSIFGTLPIEDAGPHRSMIDNSWVNFTHFLRVSTQFNEKNPCSTLDLVYFWSRQAAAIGTVNQEAWDILIPIYHTGSNTPPLLDEFFKHENMRFVLIQVKVDRTQTLTQAMKPDYERAMRNETAPKGSPSLCLFVNLARDFENELQRKEEMLLVYLAGHNTQRFPLIGEFDLEIRMALLGLIGRRANTRQAFQNAVEGSEEWAEMNARLGQDGRWFMSNASRDNSTGNQPRQDKGLIIPVQGDVTMGDPPRRTSLDGSEENDDLGAESDHGMQ